MATEQQYAWAAGFFDGEGCVGIQTVKKYSCLRVIVVQKDIRPLEAFKQIFNRDEKLGIVTRRNQTARYFQFIVSGQRAAEILRCMLPYLILKREVAIVALNFQALIEANRVEYGVVGKRPQSDFDKRKAFADQVKWLNTGRWAAAETKPSGPLTGVCDSPNCMDGKHAEGAEMTPRLN